MSMSFDMDGLPLAERATAGLAENECYPKVLINDPGFALLNSDPYLRGQRGANKGLWAGEPSQALINGRSPPFPPSRKRDLSDVEPAMFIFGNSTESHDLTPEELEEISAQIEYAEALAGDLVYVDCHGNSCATQLTPVLRYVA